MDGEVYSKSQSNCETSNEVEPSSPAIERGEVGEEDGRGACCHIACTAQHAPPCPHLRWRVPDLQELGTWCPAQPLYDPLAKPEGGANWNPEREGAREKEAAQPAQNQPCREHLPGAHVIREEGVEELAEAVRDGKAAADGAEVVFAEADFCREVGGGGREGLAAEVVAAPAEEERDVERPSPPLESSAPRRGRGIRLLCHAYHTTRVQAVQPRPL